MDPISEIKIDETPLDTSTLAADFYSQAIVQRESLSESGVALLDRYKPYLDAVEWDHPIKGIPGPKATRDLYRDTYKILLADTLHKIHMLPKSILQRESMIAGTDITTYHKQILRTVLRAFPRLIAPQLVPVVPMSGPTARVYFELLEYDTAYASSTPNISVGDTMDDLTKFNSGFAVQPAQLSDLNAIKLNFQNYVEVSESTHGLAAVSSLQGEDDLQTVHGINYNSYISERMQDMLKWFIDRRIIGAIVAAVPAASAVTWTREPTINSVSWANQTPSEKQAYRQSLWTDAVVPAMTKIYTLRYQNPNFAIAGKLAAEDIKKVNGFQAVNVFDPNYVNITTGGIRTLGFLDSGGLTVFIDPQMNDNVIILGIRPRVAFEPAVVWCPYRAIGFADDLVYPRSLKREKGAFTRFGIAQPVNGNAASAHLGDGYASITIS